MSSYINFYLKVEDKYCPLGSYSRNCSEYRFFKNIVPFEKIAPITIKNLKTVIEDIEFAISNEMKSIGRYSLNIKDIKTFNNSINEKMELIEDYRNTINELKEDLEANKKCLNFVNWLIEILTDVEYSPYADKHGITQDNYLWVGIEAGPEDIKEEGADK